MPDLKLTLDLVKIMRSNVDKPKRRVALTPFLKEEFVKVEFGKRVKDFIAEETQKGNFYKPLRGRAARYSQAYKNSFVFKLYKGTDDEVNLKLRGEMLGSMDVVGVGEKTVTIGFVSDLENTKARRHNYGLAKMPKREFFGISDKNAWKILSGVIKDFNTGREIIEINPSDVDFNVNVRVPEVNEDDEFTGELSSNTRIVERGRSG